MMEKNFLKSASKMVCMLLAMSTAMTFTSCGDDDPDDNGFTSKYKNIEIVYEASVGDGYSQFWDVEVTYTASGGSSKTAKLDSNGWAMTYSFEPTKDAPTDYVLTVVANVKSSGTQPDDNTVYSMGHAYNFIAYGVKSDGTKVLLAGPDKSSSNLSAKGSKIKELTGEKRTLIDKSYEININ
jgi:hypothetical protein